jgi:hypothetical protein
MPILTAEDKSGYPVRYSSPLLLARTTSPFGKGFYCSEEHNTEPEVHKHAQIHVPKTVPGRWRKMRHEQEIHQVPCHDSDQGLNEIHLSWF